LFTVLEGDRPAWAGWAAPWLLAAVAIFRFSLAPACADPRGMKRFQRVVGTEVGFLVGAREPVF